MIDRHLDLWTVITLQGVAIVVLAALQYHEYKQRKITYRVLHSYLEEHLRTQTIVNEILKADRPDANQ